MPVIQGANPVSQALAAFWMSSNGWCWCDFASGRDAPGHAVLSRNCAAASRIAARECSLVVCESHCRQPLT